MTILRDHMVDITIFIIIYLAGIGTGAAITDLINKDNKKNE